VGRRFKIVICRGPECGEQRGSAALHPVFASALDAHGVRERVEVSWQSCFGRCTQGPNVLVRELIEPVPGAIVSAGFATLPGPRGATALYNHIDSTRAPRIVLEHVIGGEIVRDFIERPGIHPHDLVASTTKDS
jgi:(2Fe-2S) ferredoxin